jgi:hypothetical protein
MTNYRSCRPAEYLKLGFIDENGRLREGINGKYSLMMAYRLADYGVTGKEVLAFRKKLENDFDPGSPEALKSALPADTVLRMRNALRPLGVKAAPLAELIEAASTQMSDWCAFALLAHHVERIGKQLCIVAGMRKAPHV